MIGFAIGIVAGAITAFLGLWAWLVKEFHGRKKCQ